MRRSTHLFASAADDRVILASFFVAWSKSLTFRRLGFHYLAVHHGMAVNFVEEFVKMRSRRGHRSVRGESAAACMEATGTTLCGRAPGRDKGN